MKKKFIDPSNLRLMFEVLRIENGHKRYFLSDEDRDRGARLLAEWRDSSTLDDQRLGAATVLAAIEANPDDIAGVRMAAIQAPREIQGMLFIHGALEGFARDVGGGDSDRVRQLF